MGEDDAKQQALERIAQLNLLDVSVEQIGAVCGLDAEQVLAVLASDEFARVLSEIEVNKIESAHTTNQGWDALEDMALTNLLSAMEANPDPDLSLRVAAQANKAARRSRSGALPINGDTGTAAVIQLNANYVTHLQQVNHTYATEKPERIINDSDEIATPAIEQQPAGDILQHKHFDSIDLASVESLLQDDGEQDNVAQQINELLSASIG